MSEVWDGNSWDEMTGMEVWDGSNWLESTGYEVWNGASWMTNTFGSNRLYQTRYFNASGYRSSTYEINEDTFNIIKTGTNTQEYWFQRGVGGIYNRMFRQTQTNDGNGREWTTEEFNPETLATTHFFGTFRSSRTYVGAGIGGIKNRLYTYTGDQYIREVNPNNLAQVNVRSFEDINSQDIGGIDNRLYYAQNINGDSGKLNEINPDTLADIAIHDVYPAHGVGGTKNRLYSITEKSASDSTRMTQERNPSTMALIKNIQTPAYPNGIGGTII